MTPVCGQIHLASDTVQGGLRPLLH